MKALIVEQDVMSQCVLAKLLSERGHEVSCYENAEQAILAYQKASYPLVFVDVDLPGMDGLQLCRWLRGREGGDATFIMLAVSAGQPQTLAQVLSAGANDFLVKPYELGVLKIRLAVAETQINSYFRQRELEEQLRRRELEADGLQAELRRAGEALTRDAEARRRSEDELSSVRKALGEARQAFDRQLEDQAMDLSSASEDLESATTFRSKLEDDLKRLRDEFQSRMNRAGEEATGLRQALDEEQARNRELGAVHTKAREEMQARIQELTTAARQADQRRQEAELEEQRAAAAFARAQADWEVRLRELNGQLDRARADAEKAAADRASGEIETLRQERDRATNDLAQARTQFAKRLEQHTIELLRLDQALHEALDSRRSLDEALRQAHEDLAARAADYVAAVVKAGEEVQTLQVQRQATREELDQVRSRLEVELRQAQTALDDAQSRLGKEEKQRQELEQALQEAWNELEQRPKDEPAEASGLRAELQRRESELTQERERRESVEAALQRTRAQMQDRLQRFAASLVQEPELETAGRPD